MRNVVGNFNYMKAGVLAIQGSVVEHVRALERAGASEVIEVRTCDELAEVDCLVMPGGESTTISKLMKLEGLDKALAERNMPIFGTCAGAILLEQLGLFDRFDQVAVALFAEGRPDIASIVQCGGHDDFRSVAAQNTRLFLDTSNLLECGLTVHIRHHDVKADQVVRFTGGQRSACRFDGLPTVDRNVGYTVGHQKLLH